MKPSHSPPSPDDEFGEKSVSVLLDGEESEMVFIDHPSTEMSVSWMDWKLSSPSPLAASLLIPHHLILPTRLVHITAVNGWRCVGGELLVDLRAALLCGRLLGGGQKLVPGGRRDNKLSVARKHHKGQVCDFGGQQSGSGEGSRNYHSGWVVLSLHYMLLLCW